MPAATHRANCSPVELCESIEARLLALAERIAPDDYHPTTSPAERGRVAHERAQAEAMARRERES